MAKLSPLQKAYRKYFKSMLTKYGVESPAKITPEEKKKAFFNNIRKYWENGVGSKDKWEEKINLVEEAKSNKSFPDVVLENKELIEKSVVKENTIRRIIGEEYQKLINETFSSNKLTK